MPFSSPRQRAFLWIHHPEVARDWEAKYGSKPKKVRRRRVKRAEGR